MVQIASSMSGSNHASPSALLGLIAFARSRESP
uniref:Uncharacterized protein n=1 Tax=Arundo donax TaxID=35708 RepID=A0A0A9HRZ6_ARUDO